MELLKRSRDYNLVGFIPTARVIGIAISLVSLLALLAVGIPWGLDFKGGAELLVRFEKNVSDKDVRDTLNTNGFKGSQVQSVGDSGSTDMLIRIERMSSVTDETVAELNTLVKENIASLTQGAPSKDINISFDKNEGDQLHVVLPQPVATNPNDGSAFVQEIADLKLIDSQQSALRSVVQKLTSVKLRQVKNKAGAITDASAITRDEPYQGKVKYLVQFAGISQDIEKALTTDLGGAEILKVDFVDATVAKELQGKGLIAVLIALFAILVYVALRFDILFSPGAVLALVHDALGALLLFPLSKLLGFGLEFQQPSVAALLTVVGYSINNTIVIYDRIRETMPEDVSATLTDDQVKTHVNKAINDTLSRTINTSLTTLLACLALIFAATGTIRDFAIVLSGGIFLGAFSSTFLAPAAYLFFRNNFKNVGAADDAKKARTQEDRLKGIV